jgi:hypothetical protein
MKSLIIIILFFSCSSLVFSQTNYTYSDTIPSAGDYLKFSSKAFSSAMVLSGVTAGMMVFATTSDYKEVRNVFYGFSLATTLASIFFGVKGVIYIGKAGEALNYESKNKIRIEPASSGLGVKVSF